MNSTKTIGFLSTTLAATAVLTALSASEAQAQAAFRILRPATGAKVRETTRIQFSRAALGDTTKYVQVFVDGLFRSAIAIPPASKKSTHTEQIEANNRTVSLLWNTKAIDNTPGIPDDKRVINDGPHTIEVVGLDIAGRRIGRDTVTLNVANRSGLVMPANGIPMSYRFSVGDSTNYQERAEVNFILADNQNAQAGNGGGSPYGGGFGQRAYYGSQRQGSSYGGRPGYGGGGGRGNSGGAGGGYPGAPGGFPGGGGGYPGGGSGDGTDFNPIIPVQNVRATFERSTEDRAGGNAFFIRDKVLRGIIIGGNGSAARLEQVYDFKSRYRTVESSGKVLNTSTASRPGAYVALLLPNLGGGNRRTGAKWRTATPIQLEWATLDTPPMVYADNELEGLEWQDGTQTARIRQTFNGQVKMPIFGGAGVMNDAKVSMDRTIWFGYKTGRIIRMVTKVTVEGDAPQDVISQMAPGAASAGGGQGGFPGGGGSGGRFGGPTGFPGAGDEGGGLLGAPSQGAGGGFGALLGTQGQTEEAKVPAKFQSTITVTLNRGGDAAASRVASR